MILTNTYVGGRVVFGTALADNDIACNDPLATKDFYA